MLGRIRRKVYISQARRTAAAQTSHHGGTLPHMPGNRYRCPDSQKRPHFQFEWHLPGNCRRTPRTGRTDGCGNRPEPESGLRYAAQISTGWLPGSFRWHRPAGRRRSRNNSREKLSVSMSYTPVACRWARNPTSTKPITQSIRALQYVFQIDVTVFEKWIIGKRL